MIATFLFLMPFYCGLTMEYLCEAMSWGLYCKWLGAKGGIRMDTNNNAGVVDNNNQQNQNVGVETPKTFDDMLNENPNYQSAHDKKVADALKTARASWELERAEKDSEAQKLSKMKEDERRDYELQKERKEKEDALAKLNAYELEKEAVKIASNPETQVDVSLLSLINFGNIKAEQVEPTIKNIKKVFDSAVENEVNKRLKETTPKSVNSNNTQSRERVSRISV